MTRAADPFLSRAVLIGTGRYKTLTDIPAIHSNLTALADVLRADRFWGLPPDGCVVVEDPATTADMLDPVVAAAQFATDTLLLYYAGHGLVDPRRSELHLAIPDSDPQRIYTAVSYTLVRDILLDSRAIRRVVILDCCYSGRALGQMSDIASAVADEASAEGTYIIAASAENKAALAPPGGRYTAFTGELLTLIHDGINACGPMLDLDSLYRHLLAAMTRKGLPIPQKRDRNTAGQLTLLRNQAYRQPPTDLDEIAGPDEPSGRQADRTDDQSAALSLTAPTTDRLVPPLSGKWTLSVPSSRGDASWRRRVKVATVDQPNVQVSQAVGGKRPIMGDSPSPLGLRRLLRTEIRNARLDSQLTQEQVAMAMEWSMSKMNRIEKAKSSISANDLKVLLPLLGIKDKKRTEELIALARAARESPWWSHYIDIAPVKLLELIDYESAASAVSQFKTAFVPEILQTEEYTRAVFQSFNDEESSAKYVAALVDLHTERHNMLIGETAPKFSCVLDESVVRRLVGSPSIMSRQLLHLVEAAGLSNVTIQVLPFTANLHPRMSGSFEIVQFDDTPDENILFLEGQSGDFISDDPEETNNYLEAFRHITEKSLGQSDSVDRLRKAANEIT